MNVRSCCTSVMVVPASCVVVLKDLWWGPGLQQVVHLMLLPPSQWLTQNLPGLVHVEVPRSQETQYVLIFRNLDRWYKNEHYIKIKCLIYHIDLNRFNFKQIKEANYLSLVRLLQPFTKSDQTAFLQRREVTEVTFDIVCIQFICNTKTKNTKLSNSDYFLHV